MHNRAANQFRRRKIIQELVLLLLCTVDELHIAIIPLNSISCICSHKSPGACMFWTFSSLAVSVPGVIPSSHVFTVEPVCPVPGIWNYQLILSLWPLSEFVVVITILVITLIVVICYRYIYCCIWLQTVSVGDWERERETCPSPNYMQINTKCIFTQWKWKTPQQSAESDASHIPGWDHLGHQLQGLLCFLSNKRQKRQLMQLLM